MTGFERLIAKVGITGLLAIGLAASVAVNLWQFNSASKAQIRCDSRIAEMVAEVDRKAAALEVASLEISRETARRAASDAERIQAETTRYVERIRTIRIPVPAECDGPMPDGVQDALSEAARAANRRL